MIVTITMNPSIDVSYQLDTLKIDTINRVAKTSKTAGGKGLNVTRVLKQIGADVTASGLMGGFLGEQIKKELDTLNVKHDFSPINDEIRNCIAILHEGKQTEILESGPVISLQEGNQFLKHFEQLIQQASIVSFSGSLPLGLPKNFYAEMIKICNSKNKDVLLDCSGEGLKRILNGSEKPLLIKPNIEELSSVLGRKIMNDLAAIKAALMSPLFSDIEWIVVSMGSQGAVAKHKDIFYKVVIPKVEVKNPVGSGDATVAGLAFGLSEGKSDEEILKMANALGILNAQEAMTGHVDMTKFEKTMDQIEVLTV
ncbi:tagatose-6-phosphate kinase [Marinilactibacillus psychrotolerans]|uniref:tagatose-6-phosphate kinase n=1 Tax=Marinilactibacillus psychrotolerans TaxID=191770 RepID=UPI001C7D4469|nr:tagatose-6-phosphate kinase [Marinilactibacillus psychrotolerans]GEQ34318.1 tagatose-6-phosphate kinase [Marinilactibacillus psychrotolerans]